MLANLFAPVAGLLFVLHKVLHFVLAALSLFLLFSGLSRGVWFPDVVNGLIGTVGAICALQGRYITRGWTINGKPNIVKLIAMAWAIGFAGYALFMLPQYKLTVAVMSLLSAAVMLIPFAPPEPEVTKVKANKNKDKEAASPPAALPPAG